MYIFHELYEAKSVADAIALMQAQPAAKLIAGGSDVLIKLREHAMADMDLISIYGLDELRGVTLEEDGTLRIGPLTSFSHVEQDKLIRKLIPALGEAAGKVGGPQIRNIGTVGGNVCNGVTSADTASTFLAYDTVVELTGPDGKRLVPLKDFYLGVQKVDIRPAELCTGLLIARESYENCYANYIKYSMRNALDIATIGCSANVVLSSDKTRIERARLAYGVAGPVPLRCSTAEANVKGQPVSAETVELFAISSMEDLKPRTSWRASAEFRTHIIKELARRTLREAIQLAGGTIECK